MLEHKVFPLHDFKAIDEAKGLCEMYVAIFLNRDYGNDRIMPGAFVKSLARKLPKGVWMHDTTLPIAKTLEAEEVLAGDPRLPAEIADLGGLRCLAQFNLGTQRGKEAFSDLAFGTVDEFSIGYDPIRQRKAADGVNELLELDLPEWSPVLRGMNPMTQLVGVKTVCGASGLPLASRDRAWDASAAEKGVRSWAGAEDAPNAKYRRAFMVCAGDADQFTSYKLPFAAVDGGELKAVPRAIFSIAAVLQGSRGGASLSTEDRDGAKAKVASYYAAMRRAFDDETIVVPWSDDGKSDEPAETKSQSMPHMERGMTMAALHEAHNHLMDAVADGLYNGLGVTEVAPAYDEHKAACLKCYGSLMSGSKECQVAAAKTIEQFLGEFVSPAEASYAEQLSAVLAAAEGCVSRGEEIDRLRARKGARLSSDRQEELRTLKTRLDAIGLQILSVLADPAEKSQDLGHPAELIDAARLMRLRAEYMDIVVGRTPPPPLSSS